jgi:hypothetical protein
MPLGSIRKLSTVCPQFFLGLEPNRLLPAFIKGGKYGYFLAARIQL